MWLCAVSVIVDESIMSGMTPHKHLDRFCHFCTPWRPFNRSNIGSAVFAYHDGHRSRFTHGSRVVDMIGRIHDDIFFQNRYLLNEVNVKIKLVRSRNSFCVMSANPFQAKVDSAIMFVRKVKLSLSVFLAHAKALPSI